MLTKIIQFLLPPIIPYLYIKFLSNGSRALNLTILASYDISTISYYDTIYIRVATKHSN